MRNIFANSSKNFDPGPRLEEATEDAEEATSSTIYRPRKPLPLPSLPFSCWSRVAQDGHVDRYTTPCSSFMAGKAPDPGPRLEEAIEDAEEATSSTIIRCAW